MQKKKVVCIIFMQIPGIQPPFSTIMKKKEELPPASALGDAQSHIWFIHLSQVLGKVWLQN
jgi:hypothetical protein